MKIVQLSAIDITMSELLQELNTSILDDGYELICVCSDGPGVSSLKEEGLDVRAINIDRKISPFRNLKSIYQMYRLFRKERPDIVHVHTPVASVLGRIAAKLARVPTIIYTAHGFYFHENMPKRHYKLFHTIEKVCARWCTDYIFTQSEEDGELAVHDGFLPRERITIISNGVDVQGKFNPGNVDNEKIEKVRNELNLTKDDFVVSFIGRLVEEKGILDLLEAMNHIKDKNIKLIVIGSTGASERDQSLKEKLAKYEDNSNIIYTGFRTDTPELLYISDVFCLPSYREGMPRSIIEAMAMECAIIATNIRGSREEVDEEINGFLIGLGDPYSLADRIDTLYNDRQKLKGFQNKAREKAVEYYNEKKVIRKQMKIFKSIIKDE